MYHVCAQGRVAQSRLSRATLKQVAQVLLTVAAVVVVQWAAVHKHEFPETDEDIEW